MDLTSDQLSYVAIILAVITPAAIWLGRTSIKAWIDDRVATRSAKEIEALKSDLEKDRQVLSDLRNSVLGGQATRQSMIDQKRLEAVDLLWQRVLEVDRFKMAPEMLKAIDVKKSMEAAKKDNSVTDFFVALTKLFPEFNENRSSTKTLEPFVPRDIWNLFYAYQSVTFLGVASLLTLAKGIHSEKLLNNDAVISGVLIALPTYKKFIDENGDSSVYFITDTLRSRLVEAVRSFTLGKEADEEHLQKAAEMAQKTNSAVSAELMLQNGSIPAIPDSIKAERPTT